VRGRITAARFAERGLGCGGRERQRLNGQRLNGQRLNGQRLNGQRLNGRELR
jgi:hypothetical protein